MSLTREHVINKLRELGYTYNRETHTTQCYRRGAHHVFVPKTRPKEKWVRATLRQCNLSDAEISSFLATCNS